MLKYNLLSFIRNIKQDKTSFFINLIGLSTGLACAILIYLWVKDELNIDKFHEKDSKQHFQVMVNHPYSNGINTIEYTPDPLAKSLAGEMPEIKYIISIVGPYNSFLSTIDQQLKVISQYVSDKYFNVFTCNFIEGDKSQLFSKTNAICISKETALKLFQTTENIIGQTVQSDNDIYFICGIFTPPGNSSSKFDVLLNYLPNTVSDLF